MLFPDAELKRRVRMLGGPMIFSGPVQPPMLGAALQSARLHLSDELPGLQAELRERIDQCTQLLAEFCLPLASRDRAPIGFIPVGLPQAARALTARLLSEGIYTNVAHFPAVPMKQAGVRFTLTLHHQPEDLVRLVEALAKHMPAVVDDTTATLRRMQKRRSRRSLHLEYHRSINQLDAMEWDRLLGDRGTFSAEGLRFLERTFGRAERPENHWEFHYYIVRDDCKRPVLATWFTSALWKDDMLAPAEVSALVEERRREEPYYLTSLTFAMGSLLTEGEHLYLDRSGDWEPALQLLIEALSENASASGATTLVIRDIDAADDELGAALRDRGFVGLNMPDSHVIEPLSSGDAEWLAGLSARARAHQRREVLAREDRFEVEILRRGSRTPSQAELDHLHQLYRNVRERSLEINSFELPRSLLREMLEHGCWELMLLRLADHGAAGRPVAFGAHFVGARHYAPLLIGLDYDYVYSHGSYRQALRQALVRARAHGCDSVMLGMGAPLEKRRFGATPRPRVAFVQSTDHYGQEVIADLQAAAHAHGR